MAFQLRFITHSEIGLVRKNNQDSGYASSNLLVVADGMGGAAAGDLASAVAIDAIRKIDNRTEGEQMLEILAGAIHRANDRISDLVEDDYTLEGMGTTVTGALFDGVTLGLAHIGDSRAYLFRDGRLERLTHDHSWVQSLIDDGKISAAEAAVHPHRSLLLKVLNGQPANEPDLRLVALQEGDRLLFCSDGVCGLVDDPVIGEAMAQPELGEVLEQLVAEAHAAGGIDNITVIVADVVTDAGTEGTFVLGAARELDLPAPASKVRFDETEDTIVSDRTALAAAAMPVAAKASEDEARYNPQPPSKRRLTRPLIALIAIVLVLGAALGAGYAWTRTQYFVGVSDNQVAIFTGLSDPVPGFRLSHVYEVQPLAVAALPPYYQDKVRATIDVDSLAAARETVTELADAAKRCADQSPGTPEGSPSATPVKTPKPTASPKPQVTPKPSPSPTSSPPTLTPNPEQAC